jgi:1,4-dihydroxy-2-naphthoate octaprenyltransferase
MFMKPILAKAARSTPSTLQVWLLATRPKTLVAGLVPVLLGQALAVRAGLSSLPIFLAALAWTLLIQVACNLTNDYHDFLNGADTAERLGPPRAAQSGLLSAKAVRAGAGIFYLAAVVCGAYLFRSVGWPMLAVMAASILVAYAYTGGPFPLGYNGLGDVMVFIFFGLIPVMLTYYAQVGRLDAVAWLIAIPPGTLGIAILAVNNLRDAATDVRAGKRTLVVMLGTWFGRAEYVTMVGVSLLVPVYLWAAGQAGVSVLLPLLSLPLALSPVRRMLRDSGAALNMALGETARFELVFGVLLMAGLWLDPAGRDALTAHR